MKRLASQRSPVRRKKKTSQALKGRKRLRGKRAGNQKKCHSVLHVEKIQIKKGSFPERIYWD